MALTTVISPRTRLDHALNSTRWMLVASASRPLMLAALRSFPTRARKVGKKIGTIVPTRTARRPEARTRDRYDERPGACVTRRHPLPQPGYLIDCAASVAQPQHLEMPT